MDKNTLSHYGWIVVLVLILAVLLALATPFSGFIANGFKATYIGFSHVTDKAFDVIGLGGITPDDGSGGEQGGTGDEGQGGEQEHTHTLTSIFHYTPEYVHSIICADCGTVITPVDFCVDDNHDYQCDICNTPYFIPTIKVDDTHNVFVNSICTHNDLMCTGIYYEFYVDGTLITTDDWYSQDFSAIITESRDYEITVIVYSEDDIAINSKTIIYSNGEVTSLTAPNLYIVAQEELLIETDINATELGLIINGTDYGTIEHSGTFETKLKFMVEDGMLVDGQNTIGAYSVNGGVRSETAYVTFTINAQQLTCEHSSFAFEYVDETYHLVKCAGCGLVGGNVEHQYDDNADGLCDECLGAFSW